MNKYDYKNICPFKWFILENFPFIEDDFDALTNWQLFCKLGKEINKIIKSQNEVGQAVEDFTEKFIALNNYVHDYFDNLDVQEEINNKLDEMVEDGTFERVVGDLLIKKLDYYKIDNTITQEELQELLNIEKAKVIEFTPGTYNFTATLRLNSNTKLIMNNCIINNSNVHMFFNFKNTDTEITKYNGSHNIEIIGGKFNGCFSFIHGKNIIIKNCEFYHVENDHCMEICSCQNVVVDNCTFEGVKTQPNSRNYVENIQIENATHTNFPWLEDETPTYDNTACDNIEIKNCTFNPTDIITYKFYSAIGGHTYVVDFPHNNIKIHDNIITNPSSHALRFHNTLNLEIYNNKIINNNFEILTKCIVLYNTCKNLNCYNNIIDGFDQPIYISSGSENLNINNNIIKNTQNTNPTQSSENNCITYRVVKNLCIKGNTFINNDSGIVFCINTDEDLSGSSTIFDSNTIINLKENANIFYTRNRFYSVENVIFTNNTFNENNNSAYLIRLSANVKDFMYANNNRNNLLYKIIDFNGYTGSKSKIFGVALLAYQTTLDDPVMSENTPISLDFSDFNTMILSMGASGSTNSIQLKPFDIYNRLDARTWKFPCYTSNSESPIKCSLKFNSDGTIFFSSTNNAINLRRLYFINE